MHIVLIGEMGVGKSTVGRLLADEIGLYFLDSDEVIAAATGETGSEIAEQEGVAHLHHLELQIFLDMCGAGERAVIAPAASVVDHEAGRAALGDQITVWLTAPDEVLAGRQGGHRRAVGVEERKALRKRRAPHMEALATLTVDTGSSEPGETSRRIAAWLETAEDGPT